MSPIGAKTPLVPALLNAKSSFPKADTVAPTSASTCTSSLTSQRRNAAVPPSFLIFATVSAPAVSSMSETITQAPACARATAAACPIPDPAAVTRPALPFIELAMNQTPLSDRLRRRGGRRQGPPNRRQGSRSRGPWVAGSRCGPGSPRGGSSVRLSCVRAALVVALRVLREEFLLDATHLLGGGAAEHGPPADVVLRPGVAGHLPEVLGEARRLAALDGVDHEVVDLADPGQEDGQRLHRLPHRRHLGDRPGP